MPLEPIKGATDASTSMAAAAETCGAAESTDICGARSSAVAAKNTSFGSDFNFDIADVRLGLSGSGDGTRAIEEPPIGFLIEKFKCSGHFTDVTRELHDRIKVPDRPEETVWKSKLSTSPVTSDSSLLYSSSSGGSPTYFSYGHGGGGGSSPSSLSQGGDGQSSPVFSQKVEILPAWRRIEYEKIAKRFFRDFAEEDEDEVCELSQSSSALLTQSGSLSSNATIGVSANVEIANPNHGDSSSSAAVPAEQCSSAVSPTSTNAEEETRQKFLQEQQKLMQAFDWDHLLETTRISLPSLRQVLENEKKHEGLDADLEKLIFSAGSEDEVKQKMNNLADEEDPSSSNSPTNDVSCAKVSTPPNAQEDQPLSLNSPQNSLATLPSPRERAKTALSVSFETNMNMINIATSSAWHMPWKLYTLPEETTGLSERGIPHVDERWKQIQQVLLLMPPLQEMVESIKQHVMRDFEAMKTKIAELAEKARTEYATALAEQEAAQRAAEEMEQAVSAEEEALAELRAIEAELAAQEQSSAAECADESRSASKVEPDSISASPKQGDEITSSACAPEMQATSTPALPHDHQDESQWPALSNQNARQSAGNTGIIRAPKRRSVWDDSKARNSSTTQQARKPPPISTTDVDAAINSCSGSEAVINSRANPNSGSQDESIEEREVKDREFPSLLSANAIKSPSRRAQRRMSASRMSSGGGGSWQRLSASSQSPNGSGPRTSASSGGLPLPAPNGNRSNTPKMKTSEARLSSKPSSTPASSSSPSAARCSASKTRVKVQQQCPLDCKVYVKDEAAEQEDGVELEHQDTEPGDEDGDLIFYEKGKGLGAGPRNKGKGQNSTPKAAKIGRRSSVSKQKSWQVRGSAGQTTFRYNSKGVNSGLDEEENISAANAAEVKPDTSASAGQSSCSAADVIPAVDSAVQLSSQRDAASTPDAAISSACAGQGEQGATTSSAETSSAETKIITNKMVLVKPPDKQEKTEEDRALEKQLEFELERAVFAHILNSFPMPYFTPEEKKDIKTQLLIAAASSVNSPNGGESVLSELGNAGEENQNLVVSENVPAASAGVEVDITQGEEAKRDQEHGHKSKKCVRLENDKSSVLADKEEKDSTAVSKKIKPPRLRNPMELQMRKILKRRKKAACFLLKRLEQLPNLGDRHEDSLQRFLDQERSKASMLFQRRENARLLATMRRNERKMKQAASHAAWRARQSVDRRMTQVVRDIEREKDELEKEKEKKELELAEEIRKKELQLAAEREKERQEREAMEERARAREKVEAEKRRIVDEEAQVKMREMEERQVQFFGFKIFVYFAGVGIDKYAINLTGD